MSQERAGRTRRDKNLQLQPAATNDESAAGLSSGDGPADSDDITVKKTRAAKASSQSPSFLSTYFREMADLEVFAPDEELSAAQRLEANEIAVWTRALSYPPTLAYALDRAEALLREHEVEPPEELATLRRVAAQTLPSRPKPSRRSALPAALREAIEACASALHRCDRDRKSLTALITLFHALMCKSTARDLPSPPLSATSRAFRSYVGRIDAAEEQVQRERNAFVKANLRLVVSIARRFNHGRMALADLIQEGNLGLMKAVERYDYRRGFRFSTYASWWIRHAISRALADKGREVRLPVHMLDAQQKLSKATRQLTTKLGRRPNNQELAEETGIQREKIEKMRTYLIDQSISLDRPVNDEDGRPFGEYLQDPITEEESAFTMLSAHTLTSEVRRTIDELPPIEADILRRRFGLDDDQELTLKQIGARYNLSRERIRQLQEQALTKVRRSLQRKHMM